MAICGFVVPNVYFAPAWCSLRPMMDYLRCQISISSLSFLFVLSSFSIVLTDVDRSRYYSTGDFYPWWNVNRKGPTTEKCKTVTRTAIETPHAFGISTENATCFGGFLPYYRSTIAIETTFFRGNSPLSLIFSRTMWRIWHLYRELQYHEL